MTKPFNEYIVTEWHKGLFNPKVKTHTTVQSFSNMEAAKAHYDKVKDNVQKVTVSLVILSTTN